MPDQARAKRRQTPKQPATAVESPIRFGIPSLDVLLGRPQPSTYENATLKEDEEAKAFGIAVADAKANLGRESISACVIGSDGTGKSVLALHLAAQYLADRLGKQCRVIYVSTDLSFHRTKTTWDNFALSYPRHRITDPFDLTDREKKERHRWETLGAPPEPEIDLTNLSPFMADPETFAEFSAAHPSKKIHFIDLTTQTSGDDWGYLNHLVAGLRHPKQEDPDAPLHLLLIDTVDDLEILVGERDAYGALRDRRSRVAELIRTATGKCHVVFIASEPPSGKAPEEFIADVVVRVRFRQYGEYLARTVNVEKVRGQNSIRGDHDLTIRSGIGASTGDQEHFDDPRIVRLDSTAGDPRFSGASKEPLDAGRMGAFQTPTSKNRPFQSYVYVFHSLHYINNSIMRADGPSIHIEKEEKKFAKFGIQYLDDMLAVPSANANASEPDGGLPTHEPAVLIGEDGTDKSEISNAFLSRALLPADRAVAFSGKQRAPKPGNTPSTPHGVAVLLSTKALDCDTLLERLNEHLPTDDQFTSRNDANATYRDHVICRRLEFHHMSSAGLFHIVTQAIRAAQRIIFSCDDVRREVERELQGSNETFSPHEAIPSLERIRRKFGWRIRLVIGNWATLRQLYPDVGKDPLFLPCLLFFLRREGIATLIVANEERGFSAGFNLAQNHDLRDQTGVHIFTWRTPFFGESRIAITVNPPINPDRRTEVIRELRRLSSKEHVRAGDDQVLAVSPSFELFIGLDKGQPEYVPLRVCLYGEPTASSKPVYLEDIHSLFGWMLKGDATADILHVEQPTTYERLREFSQLQGASRFPYTLVLQVDEFWAKTGPLPLHRMDRYLKIQTAQSSRREDGEWFHRHFVVEDPLRVFQPSDAQMSLDGNNDSPGPIDWSRLKLFSPAGYNLKKHVDASGEHLVKVPYTWDFGFLMIHKELWEQATDEVPAARGILERLRDHRSSPANWFKFVNACVEITNFANRRFREGKHFSTFSIAPEQQESLSCLLLEIWASEIRLDLQTKSAWLDKVLNSELKARNCFDRHRDERETSNDLPALVRLARHQLLRALCLLLDLIPHNLVGADNHLVAGEQPGTLPVAARTWYSSAGSYQSRFAEDWYIPARLPGHYSVRGDWFLAIARGSLSHRLGERAIDLLSTRRANIVRVQTGIGLPVRENGNEDAIELWTSLWTTKAAVERVRYSDLLKYGGPVTGEDDVAMGGPLIWLWRSRILNYDRHARIFRRWICSVLRRLNKKCKGKSGREVYQRLASPTDCEKDAVWKWFATSEVDQFVETLARATPAQGSDGSRRSAE